MSAFPFYTQAGGRELIVHAAYFCVEAFPPHRRQFVLVSNTPGPLRPELVQVYGDDSQVMDWLVASGRIPPTAARQLVELAAAVEARFMATARERQAQRVAEGQR